MNYLLISFPELDAAPGAQGHPQGVLSWNNLPRKLTNGAGKGLIKAHCS